MLKRIIRGAVFICVFSTLALIVSNFIIERDTKKLVFNSIDEIPKKKVGLVLGTVKYLQNGQVNLYYTYRLNAAYELYSNKKISFILISGDNGTKNYDEPSTFKEDLIKLGVPTEKIYLDYAGFRTLDSVVRANKIFGLEEFIVISQKFHNQRAVYIAGIKGVKAIGYNARDVSKNYGFKTNLREKFARVKVFLDFLLMKQPKFLGKQIEIK